ncbi:hypothetical protein CDAR_524661 [Caerostris darwini]|uniref:Uncharacterized protein n=1 Tax=Caerostris darwini TaxID=1538125 RepID=A0AAV4R0M4_9ARAC|nr:hypothetical protein CDAR_524661 [Caerostris darwini]
MCVFLPHPEKAADGSCNPIWGQVIAEKNCFHKRGVPKEGRRVRAEGEGPFENGFLITKPAGSGRNRFDPVPKYLPLVFLPRQTAANRMPLRNFEMKRSVWQILGSKGCSI